MLPMQRNTFRSNSFNLASPTCCQMTGTAIGGRSVKSTVSNGGNHMSWMKKLFGLTEPRTALDEVQEVGGQLIVTGYRRLAGQHGCAPTSKTSDPQIIEMYKKVGTAFRDVADRRGERLSAGTLNSIVWKFFQVSEMLGNEFVDKHLAYEVQKYLQEGLRPEYIQDIDLF